jgi:hypothetical protein
MSRFGLIRKGKFDAASGTWKPKLRIILDARQSGVTAATGRTHRSILPRVMDAATDMLDMSAELQPDEELEQLVLDISDAFWGVPLLKKERKFFVAKLGNQFLVFLRTAQGSRAAPLT